MVKSTIHAKDFKAFAVETSFQVYNELFVVRRSWVRISPGYKVFRTFYLAMLFFVI
jgi:hypothetical protein